MGEKIISKKEFDEMIDNEIKKSINLELNKLKKMKNKKTPFGFKIAGKIINKSITDILKDIHKLEEMIYIAKEIQFKNKCYEQINKDGFLDFGTFRIIKDNDIYYKVKI